ncbi:uncharacterized protein BDZ99DRAFT_153017 [Mytilinidion resinicola]|uniref:Uncharacterized protein n=1 Tax=Mytilinidion resinicola TaxID=574789 RepID=A0A6A6Y6N2_9PEZI|nr:uncharacterized protein BDZ99DRAFT_153017 [Mytilinidion resinicola]KAF2804462.1 hypothetical protein BDZ99DRAFT_153017 [Mytilinidion resinicola]
MPKLQSALSSGTCVLVVAPSEKVECRSDGGTLALSLLYRPNSRLLFGAVSSLGAVSSSGQRSAKNVEQRISAGYAEASVNTQLWYMCVGGCSVRESGV